MQLVEAERTPELAAYLEKLSGVVNYVSQTFSLFKAAEEVRPARLLTPKGRLRCGVSLRSTTCAPGAVTAVLATERLIEAPNWHPEGWLLVNGEGRLWRVPLDRPALHAGGHRRARCAATTTMDSRLTGARSTCRRIPDAGRRSTRCRRAAARQSP